MQHFIVFPKYEKNEGQYQEVSEQSQMRNEKGEPRLFCKKPFLKVQDVYKERGGSDFLKSGGIINVSDKVQRLFFENGFQGIQFIPLLINNNGIHKGYAFVHKITTYDILDPLASEAEDFDEDDNTFSFVYHLYLDKKKFKSENIVHDIFMCSTYTSRFICNERVKAILEAANVTGIKFNPVEFSS